MKKHSDFSPSSFERRLLCPASYIMEKDLPPTTSKYAEEGINLHLIVSKEIEQRRFFESDEDFLNHQRTKHDANPNVDLIVNALKSYLEIINKFDTYIVDVDKKVYLNFLGDTESGTLDLAITGRTKEGKDELHIVDFKFGRGVAVEAHMNFQLLLYLKGYLEEAKLRRRLFHCEYCLHIIQPTMRNTSWFLTEEEKEQWLYNDEFYKNVVAKCKVLEPAFNPTTKACKFCKAKAICKPLATSLDFKEKNVLKEDDLKSFLDKKELMQLYLKSLDDYCLNFLDNGGTIRGYRLVEKYSNRKWMKTAEEELKSLLGDRAFISKKNLITIGQAEKLLTKEQVNKLTEKEITGKVIEAITDELKFLN